MFDSVNRDPSPSELRKFGLTILVGLALIGALLWWWKGWTGPAIVLWAVGGGIFAITAGSVPLGTKVYVVWMAVAAGIGMIMLPVLLSLVFFIFLPLFALIRFTDPLRIKHKKSGTYWERHKPHEATIERMLRPF